MLVMVVLIIFLVTIYGKSCVLVVK